MRVVLFHHGLRTATDGGDMPAWASLSETPQPVKASGRGGSIGPRPQGKRPALWAGRDARPTEPNSDAPVPASYHPDPRHPATRSRKLSSWLGFRPPVALSSPIPMSSTTRLT